MWSRTVEIDVETDLLDNREYVADRQFEAVKAAGDDLSWKEGVVTDCEEFPQLAEG